jgi:hypothetical protein
MLLPPGKCELYKYAAQSKNVIPRRVESNRDTLEALSRVHHCDFSDLNKLQKIDEVS